MKKGTGWRLLNKRTYPVPSTLNPEPYSYVYFSSPNFKFA
jgi:hypothetical protein